MKKREPYASHLTLAMLFLVLNHSEETAADITIAEIIAALFAVRVVVYPCLRIVAVALREHFHSKQESSAVFFHLSTPAESGVIVQDIKATVLTTDSFLVIDSDGSLHSLSDRLGKSYVLIKKTSISNSSNAYHT